MGFIKHALIGIALYEAAKYFLNKEDRRFFPATEGMQVDAAAQQLKEGRIFEPGSRDLGANPDTPLSRAEPAEDREDPWKNSLANDELRAPDS